MPDICGYDAEARHECKRTRTSEWRTLSTFSDRYCRASAACARSVSGTSGRTSWLTNSESVSVFLKDRFPCPTPADPATGEPRRAGESEPLARRDASGPAVIPEGAMTPSGCCRTAAGNARAARELVLLWPPRRLARPLLLLLLLAPRPPRRLSSRFETPGRFFFIIQTFTHRVERFSKRRG
jgi:hypothetical protein